jgi:hypothetical protein
LAVDAVSNSSVCALLILDFIRAKKIALDFLDSKK